MDRQPGWLHHQGVSGRTPQHRALRGLRRPTPADRRGQPRARASCSTGAWPRGWSTRAGSSCREGCRPDNVGRGHRPPPSVGRRRVPAGWSPHPGSRTPASSASSWRPPTMPRGQPRDRVGGERPPDADRPMTPPPGANRDAVRLAGRVVASQIMGDPGPSGRFGQFGGRFVPESLVPACHGARSRPSGRPGPTRPSAPSSTASWPRYGGRPTPVTECGRLSARARACGCCSSARTWPTPVRTRSTTWSARDCWPGGWARTA